jgi:capsular exopolysaccharide synthesis family protein
MSVIHEKLRKLEAKENPQGGGAWYSAPSHSPTIDFGLPEEIIKDFYDLKEYVRIANMRGQMRLLSVVGSHDQEGSTTVVSYLAYLLAGGMLRKKQSTKKEILDEKGDEKVFKKDFEKAVSDKSDKDSDSDKPSVDDILLVDCNMRNPGVHRYFGLTLEDGLADILEHKLDWHKVVKSVKNLNLKVISAGKSSENPVELMGSEEFNAMIREWRKAYKYVLFDSAPVLTAPEALSLGAMVDGVILVVRSGVTRWENAQAAKRKLISAHAKLLGVALNRAQS